MSVSPLIYLETTYAYDALNRVTSKTYNDNDATPNILYKYDAQTLPAGAPNSTIFDRGASTGRLVSVTYGGTAAGTYYGYDDLGRVVERVQQTDGTNYEVNATYNRASAMLTETYPAALPATTRRTVTRSFDGAGRLASLSTAGASVTAIQYASHGALAQENYGTLTHQIGYNTRLQPTSVKLVKSSDATIILLDLSYTYGTATTNNGNVTAAKISVQNAVGTTDVWDQTFTYDELNRLDVAKEMKGGAQQWIQNNEYDKYGNRWMLINGSPSLSFNASNNRINTSGYSYDLAGNLMDDTQHTYSYDAEDHLKMVDGASAYIYDGEGQRVRKLMGGNLLMVYGIAGEVLAEFDGAATNKPLKKEYIYGAQALAATVETGVGTQYVTADHLGSARILTNASGVVISRHDYQPFGEELFLAGGRAITQGYDSPTGTLRQKFAGYERDNEAGLDFAQARYYASTQGRFTGADPLFLELKRLGGPQLLNLYTYVRNNPLKFTDATGLDIRLTNIQQEEYIRTLQQSIRSFNVTLDSNHMVAIDTSDIPEQFRGEYLNTLRSNLVGEELELFNAITDTENHATIDTGNGQPDTSVFFGEYGAGGNQRLDFADLNQLDAPQNAGGITASQVVAHETLEAYASSQGSNFGDAHSYANQYYGGLDPIPNSGRLQTDANGRATGGTAEFTVRGSPGVTERVTLQYVTPMPVSSLPQPANVVNVERVP